MTNPFAPITKLNHSSVPVWCFFYLNNQGKPAAVATINKLQVCPDHSPLVFLNSTYT